MLNIDVLPVVASTPSEPMPPHPPPPPRPGEPIPDEPPETPHPEPPAGPISSAPPLMGLRWSTAAPAVAARGAGAGHPHAGWPSPLCCRTGSERIPATTHLRARR